MKWLDDGLRIVALSLSLLAASGCGESTTDPGTGDAGKTDAGTNPGTGDAGKTDSGRPGASFGESCTMASDCSSEVCGLFNQLGGQKCTEMCTADDQCPVGSSGARKCNNEHLCRP